MVMVQEYADGGDLFSLLQKYGGRLGEKVAVQMVLDPFLRVLQVSQRADRASAGCHYGRLLAGLVTKGIVGDGTAIGSCAAEGCQVVYCREKEGSS